jgi:divalent metal cation (Fe/Co/Zn/Cd) transporter
MSISMPDRSVWIRAAVRLEYFSLAWMTAEGVAGVVSGAASGSLSLEVFGLDSLAEIVAAGVVLWRLLSELRSGAAPDRWRVEATERRATAVIGVCLLALAAYVIAGVTQRVLSRRVSIPGVTGVVVAIAAIVVMPWLWRRKRRLGAMLDSAALEEDGFGNLACAWMALILLFGLLAAWNGWWWADPAASLVLGMFVAREGWEAWTYAGRHT